MIRAPFYIGFPFRPRFEVTLPLLLRRDSLRRFFPRIFRLFSLIKPKIFHFAHVRHKVLGAIKPSPPVGFIHCPLRSFQIAFLNAMMEQQKSRRRKRKSQFGPLRQESRATVQRRQLICLRVIHDAGTIGSYEALIEGCAKNHHLQAHQQLGQGEHCHGER